MSIPFYWATLYCEGVYTGNPLSRIVRVTVLVADGNEHSIVTLDRESRYLQLDCVTRLFAGSISWNLRLGGSV